MGFLLFWGSVSGCDQLWSRVWGPQAQGGLLGGISQEAFLKAHRHIGSFQGVSAAASSADAQAELLVGEGGFGTAGGALAGGDVSADVVVEADGAVVFGTGAAGIAGEAGRLEPAA